MANDECKHPLDEIPVSLDKPLIFHGLKEALVQSPEHNMEKIF